MPGDVINKFVRKIVRASGHPGYPGNVIIPPSVHFVAGNKTATDRDLEIYIFLEKIH